MSFGKQQDFVGRKGNYYFVYVGRKINFKKDVRMTEGSMHTHYQYTSFHNLAVHIECDIIIADDNIKN